MVVFGSVYDDYTELKWNMPPLENEVILKVDCLLDRFVRCSLCSSVYIRVFICNCCQCLIGIVVNCYVFILIDGRYKLLRTKCI